jgi:hypothetical protein
MDRGVEERPSYPRSPEDGIDPHLVEVRDLGIRGFDATPGQADRLRRYFAEEREVGGGLCSRCEASYPAAVGVGMLFCEGTPKGVGGLTKRPQSDVPIHGPLVRGEPTD